MANKFEKTQGIDDVLEAVRAELAFAMAKFKPMRSGHEGYAIILEELDELWQEIKHGTEANARKEAVQFS